MTNGDMTTRLLDDITTRLLDYQTPQPTMPAMENDIVIRPATLADAGAISAVHCSTVDTWRNPVTRQATDYAALDLFGRWYNGGPWMSPDLCAIHLNALLLAGHLPLVAVVENQVIGEAEYFVNHEPEPFGSSLHLSVLYIHKHWQRRGIGGQLIDVGVEYARTLGCITMTTQPESEAMDFYQRAGFRPWRRAKEMQIKTQGEFPDELTSVTKNTGVPENLAMRIGRYQCSAQGWDVFWPTLALPGFTDLRRSLWAGELAGAPVVLGIREQLRDPSQADGYAWLPSAAPLTPAVSALRALGAREGYNAIDLLLSEDALPDLKTKFRLDYQTTLDLWRREIS